MASCSYKSTWVFGIFQSPETPRAEQYQATLKSSPLVNVFISEALPVHTLHLQICNKKCTSYKMGHLIVLHHG